jgi:hypothetical protein
MSNATSLLHKLHKLFSLLTLAFCVRSSGMGYTRKQDVRIRKRNDRAVDIATGWTSGGVGVRIPVRSRIFTSPLTQTGTGDHQVSYPMGTGGSFPRGVKQQGREADHSPPTSAEVKKTWIYTSTPPHVFMALCLVKYWDNFTFYHGLEPNLEMEVTSETQQAQERCGLPYALHVSGLVTDE